MTDQEAIISAAIAGPIVAAIVSPAISRSGRLNTLDHVLKRLDILKKLLELNTQVTGGKNKEELEKRVQEETLHLLRGSFSTKSKINNILEKHRSRTFLYRIVFLPRPINISGWIATIIYYIYGFSAIVAIVQFPSFIRQFENLTLAIIPSVLILGIVMGARAWAMNSIKKEGAVLDNT